MKANSKLILKSHNGEQQLSSALENQTFGLVDDDGQKISVIIIF